MPRSNTNVSPILSHGWEEKSNRFSMGPLLTRLRREGSEGSEGGQPLRGWRLWLPDGGGLCRRVVFADAQGAWKRFRGFIRFKRFRGEGIALRAMNIKSALRDLHLCLHSCMTKSKSLLPQEGGVAVRRRRIGASGLLLSSSDLSSGLRPAPS